MSSRPCFKGKVSGVDSVVKGSTNTKNLLSHTLHLLSLSSSGCKFKPSFPLCCRFLCTSLQASASVQAHTHTHTVYPWICAQMWKNLDIQVIQVSWCQHPQCPVPDVTHLAPICFQLHACLNMSAVQGQSGLGSLTTNSGNISAYLSSEIEFILRKHCGLLELER